jgi:predicted transcriptional regulator
VLQQHLLTSLVGEEYVNLRIEKTTTTDKQTLFRYIIVAATNILDKRRRVVLSHNPTRFAFFVTFASLIFPSLFAIQSNQSALRRNSKTIIKIEHTRDRFEVYATMLEAAINGGIKKFDILYEAYPDPRDFNAHMQLLIQNRLLIKEGLSIKEAHSSRDNTNAHYRTTNKGFVYLELYRELERLCPSLTIYVSN